MKKDFTSKKKKLGDYYQNSNDSDIEKELEKKKKEKSNIKKKLKSFFKGEKKKKKKKVSIFKMNNETKRTRRIFEDMKISFDFEKDLASSIESIEIN